jgi:hypothetical protein
MTLKDLFPPELPFFARYCNVALGVLLGSAAFLFGMSASFPWPAWIALAILGALWGFARGSEIQVHLLSIQLQKRKSEHDR